MGLQNFLLNKLIESSTIGKKIQSATDISSKGQFALDATEKNPNIEGSLAENIANLENQAKRLENSVKKIVSLPNGASTGDGQIEDAKVGIEGETYDTLGDAIREQIKSYSDVEVSNAKPTNKAKVWINTTENDNEDSDIVIPEIDDTHISEVNTWSSKKISESITENADSIIQLENHIFNGVIKNILMNVTGGEVFAKSEKVFINANTPSEFIFVDSEHIFPETERLLIGIRYVDGTYVEGTISVRPNTKVYFTPTKPIKGLELYIASSVTSGNAELTIIDKRERVFNPLTNKICSIIGDSYSTFNGWLPSGNTSWYFEDVNPVAENDVHSVNNTWWYKLIEELKMSLLLNNSYSGSKICNDGDASYSFLTRADATMAGYQRQGIKPQIIFVFGGTNDYWNNVPLGDIKYSDWSEEDLKKFAPAYSYLIYILKKNNPGVTIFNIVNSDFVGDYGENIKYCFDVISEHYGVTNIRLHDIDKIGDHPSVTGMEQIKNQIIEEMYK